MKNTGKGSDLQDEGELSLIRYVIDNRFLHLFIYIVDVHAETFFLILLSSLSSMFALVRRRYPSSIQKKKRSNTLPLGYSFYNSFVASCTPLLI